MIINNNNRFIPNVIMTTLTSPTNESYSIAYSNPNRLESSDLYSPPPNPLAITITDSKKQYVEFEEYLDEEKHKNELVIVVEDSFECKILDVPGMRNRRNPTSVFESCQSDERSPGIEMEGILERNRELEARVLQLEKENEGLVERVEALI